MRTKETFSRGMYPTYLQAPNSSVYSYHLPVSYRHLNLLSMIWCLGTQEEITCMCCSVRYSRTKRTRSLTTREE